MKPEIKSVTPSNNFSSTGDNPFSRRKFLRCSGTAVAISALTLNGLIHTAHADPGSSWTIALKKKTVKYTKRGPTTNNPTEPDQENKTEFKNQNAPGATAASPSTGTSTVPGTTTNVYKKGAVKTGFPKYANTTAAPQWGETAQNSGLWCWSITVTTVITFEYAEMGSELPGPPGQ